MSIFEFIHTHISIPWLRHGDDRGAAMVEYALVVAGVAIFVGAAVLLFGTAFLDLIGTI